MLLVALKIKSKTLIFYDFSNRIYGTKNRYLIYHFWYFGMHLKLLTILFFKQLESALPLATHLNENLSEVEVWLEEMEAELKAQGQPGENLEEVKKQHDHLKVSLFVCHLSFSVLF